MRDILICLLKVQDYTTFRNKNEKKRRQQKIGPIINRLLKISSDLQNFREHDIRKVLRKVIPWESRLFQLFFILFIILYKEITLSPALGTCEV